MKVVCWNRTPASLILWGCVLFVLMIWCRYGSYQALLNSTYVCVNLILCVPSVNVILFLESHLSDIMSLLLSIFFCEVMVCSRPDMLQKAACRVELCSHTKCCKVMGIIDMICCNMLCFYFLLSGSWKLVQCRFSLQSKLWWQPIPNDGLMTHCYTLAMV